MSTSSHLPKRNSSTSIMKFRRLISLILIFWILTGTQPNFLNSMQIWVISEDFNVRSISCWINDLGTLEGLKMNQTLIYSLKQVIIPEPTNLLSSWSSWNDLPNLLEDRCVHPSLHLKCHHQIVYSKFNLKTRYQA